MHCPCCCSAKQGAGIGTLASIGLAAYIATHSTTVKEAVARFLIVAGIGVGVSLAILIPATIRYLRANRVEPLAPIGVYRAEIAAQRTEYQRKRALAYKPVKAIAEAPVHVITSAPMRPDLTTVNRSGITRAHARARSLSL